MKEKTSSSDQKKFIPYFPFGYPTIPSSLDIIETLAKNGADAIEIGMSFSDPLADGPVIQHATQLALTNGVTVNNTLDAIDELRNRNVTKALYLMGYYNPILAYGINNFAKRIESLGISGLIIPDLPMEEANELSAHLDKCAMIRMIAPTTPAERIDFLASGAEGFIYLVGMTGVTGSSGGHSAHLKKLVSQIRKSTSIPVYIGFGISNFAIAREMSKISDGVIVGTNIIKCIEAAEDKIVTATELARGFSNAVTEK